MGPRDGPDLRDLAALLVALAGIRDGQVAVALGCPDPIPSALASVGRVALTTEELGDGEADLVVCFADPDLAEIERVLRPGGKAVVPAGTDTAGWPVRHEVPGWRVVGRTMRG